MTDFTTAMSGDLPAVDLDGAIDTTGVTATDVIAAVVVLVATLIVATVIRHVTRDTAAHNFLARLALDEGGRKAAGEHAEKAYDYALCDGPPHCYKPALEEAPRGPTAIPTLGIVTKIPSLLHAPASAA